MRQSWADDYSDGVKRQRVTDAIQGVNGRIGVIAADRSIPVADFFGAVEAIFMSGALCVRGVVIDLETASDDANHFFCADGVHPGYVAQGILANQFIEALNVYGVDAASGTRLWQHETGGAVDAAPMVSGGVVYVGSTDGYMYAFRPIPR